MLGLRHAEAVVAGGGHAVLLDVSMAALERARTSLGEMTGLGAAVPVSLFVADVTDRASLESVRDAVVAEHGRIDILINNAANNPKVEGGSDNLKPFRFHDLPLSIWEADLAVGLTGAFLCAQVFGEVMERQGRGVVLNISSDYGLISPNQSVYRKAGLSDDEQVVKPVSYSVVKHALIGLTRYLATYWAQCGIRVNTLCPASIANGQDDEFVGKLAELIPLGRMSRPDEYPATILYMVSGASSYMTGATVVLDGGRTAW